MRGIAVVCMIAMHTADGWLAPDAQQGLAWEVVRFFGGMAAPLFLLLAGISLGLGWAVPGAGPAARLRAGVGRGLQLALLGYALRVQMWMLDGAGYRSARAWLAAALLVAGYGALYVGLGRWSARWRAGRLLGAGVVLTAAGVSLVSFWIPGRMGGILRVDVLQAIGASIAIVSAAAAWLSRGRDEARRLALALPGLALLVGLFTPVMRAWVPGPLPAPLAAYLARWEPAPGALPTGLFPLFPWLAYVFVGAAVGLYWGRRANAGSTTRPVLALASVGAMLALATCEVIPAVFALLEDEPWLTQSFRAAYRIGLGLVAGGLCLALARVPFLRGALLLLGRASLVVYWVHLELVYGPVAGPLAHRLATSAWSGWALALLASMIAFAGVVASVRRGGWKHANSERSPARPVVGERRREEAL